MRLFGVIEGLILAGFFALSTIAQAQLQPGSAGTQKLRIVTLNFNAETNNQILQHARFKIFEDYLIKQNVDVVFVQESWQLDKDLDFAIAVARDLNMDVAYHLEAGVAGIRVDSITILAKKTLKLRNIHAFKLPHSAFSAGNGQTTWFALGEVNMLIGGTVTLPNDEDAYVWTSHLAANSEPHRVDQIKYAVKKMQAVAAADGRDWSSVWSFYGGDFNASPESAEIEYLKSVGGYRDTWLTAHPGDPGHTLVGDINDPEYNPMVHGAGMFPSQENFQPTDRIDYLFAHVPQNFSAAVTRVFTSPLGSIWMSDHYGLLGNFDFAGGDQDENPSADSDMASLGSPVIFNLTEAMLDAMPARRDFDVHTVRGFTVTSEPDVNVQIFFTDQKKMVYPVSGAALGPGDTASFAFFASGDYPYRMIIRDYRPAPGAEPQYWREPRVFEMDGTIRVFPSHF